jgi:hypothetical protein
MTIPSPLGRSADQILATALTDELDHSSWHFYQARSWLDLAQRLGSPSAIQYAALELRYGLEYVLFELLVLRNHLLSKEEYERCIGSRAEMDKMLKHTGNRYPKLCRFTELVLRAGKSTIPFRFWDLGQIARDWGIASEYLHFLGSHDRTLQDSAWRDAAITRLSGVMESIWRGVTETVGSPLLNPDKMEPEIRQAWEQFQSGAMTEEDVSARVRILAPILNERIANRIARGAN